MNEKEIRALLQKYRGGECTLEELAFLESWYAQWNQDTPFDLPSEELRADLTVISEAIPTLGNRKTKEKLLWPRFAAAASILLFLSIGGYFFLHKQRQQQQIAQNQVQDIAPGTNKAILTLANGKKIVLNHTQNGLLAQQGASVVKSANGEVVYQQTVNETPGSELTYNSITIPRGAEYQVVVLPDGSKVWINSASSLRYPTAFTGNERKVELTGEAYFEVAHNPAKPFRVTSNSQTVEVLGTHFNINSYDDEPATKTTLLEGKVKVTASADNAVRILQPGQQSELNAGSFIIKPVETDEAVAWKNGKFMFERDNIQYIMRTVSRWYNVDVEYSGTVPDDNFKGGTSRYKNVSELLSILQLTGKVHFKIEGRKIIVSK
jgi:transmembrane sensor